MEKDFYLPRCLQSNPWYESARNDNDYILEGEDIIIPGRGDLLDIIMD